jgi:hypothetical protein
VHRVLAILVLALFACSILVSAPAASPASSPAKHARKGKKGKRKGHRRTNRRLTRRVGVAWRAEVAANTPIDSAPAAGGDTIVDADFENGLSNWNIAGVGEVVPTVVGGDTRSGAFAGRVVLNGSQSRSELGLGGDGTDDPGGLEFFEGDEYWFGFSFNIKRMVYGGPGAHNLIMQFHQQGEGSPNFGLQLWDYEGDDGVSGGKGLWSHSGAMGGDRFLSPVSEDAWHDVAIHFRASNSDDGFYEVYLDGRLIDARSGVSMIVPGFDSAYIKTGLYRNGATAPGSSELLLDEAKLGTTAASVQPG